MPKIVIQDATGILFRDVEEYDEKTGSVTRYLLDGLGKRIIDPLSGKSTTIRSQRPKPLIVVNDGRTIIKR